MFYLIDDGTLDTLVKCDTCDEEIRFDSNGLGAAASEGLSDGGTPYTDDELDHMRVKDALEQAETEHTCIPEQHEQQLIDGSCCICGERHEIG